jgi:hypothetical protein
MLWILYSYYLHDPSQYHACQNTTSSQWHLMILTCSSRALFYTLSSACRCIYKSKQSPLIAASLEVSGQISGHIDYWASYRVLIR